MARLRKWKKRTKKNRWPTPGAAATQPTPPPHAGAVRRDSASPPRASRWPSAASRRIWEGGAAATDRSRCCRHVPHRPLACRPPSPPPSGRSGGEGRREPPRHPETRAARPHSADHMPRRSHPPPASLRPDLGGEGSRRRRHVRAASGGREGRGGDGPAWPVGRSAVEGERGK